MNNFNKLIERSYKAIQDRGLIKRDTNRIEFLEKLEEEIKECWHSMNIDDDYIQELIDVATVIIMQIHHLGYDFVKEFEKVIIKNENRIT